MTDAEFEILRSFLKTRSGLQLTAEKRYLLESRLGPVCRKHGMSTVGELARALKAGGAELERAVVEAMTTNETFFFRDRTPFDLFRAVLLPPTTAALDAMSDAGLDAPTGVDYAPTAYTMLNLIGAHVLGHLGQFDIVFCRNVLIYFDGPTKADVFRRLAGVLAPDGSLLLGAAETVIGLTEALVPDPAHRGLYVQGRPEPFAAPLRMAASR